MPRSIVTYPHPVLAGKARPVTEITDETRALAAEMAELMYQDNGIGLAAPQVAEPLRLITVDLSGPERREDLRVFVNPVLSAPEGEVESEEGCLSVPGYRATVKRAERLHLSALDLNGNPVEMDADGLMAICLQHEVDHLDGVLFIDRISRLKRTLYERKYKKWLAQKK
ncbi:peptide deformylase [Desulfomicrobium orale]|uniref:Peptide deformylase n=1 Tax=Desulfomicrobium orale DSM 12838 TaxID=888061 RepID=A0A0X8JQ71_9BACT|nr:peptide deformylase [Desulfomicrobium orale]AMD92503.1 peptide deformylase [Desulfomicrobium orale DSM 12838]